MLALLFLHSRFTALLRKLRRWLIAGRTTWLEAPPLREHLRRNIPALIRRSRRSAKRPLLHTRFLLVDQRTRWRLHHSLTCLLTSSVPIGKRFLNRLCRDDGTTTLFARSLGFSLAAIREVNGFLYALRLDFKRGAKRIIFCEYFYYVHDYRTLLTTCVNLGAAGNARAT